MFPVRRTLHEQHNGKNEKGRKEEQSVHTVGGGMPKVGRASEGGTDCYAERSTPNPARFRSSQKPG